MNLAGMEQLAVDLRRPSSGYTPITDLDVNRDIQILMGREMEDWRSIIAGLDGPVALDGGIAGSETTPLGTGLAAVTTGTTEVALWAASTYTPLPANRIGPKHYEVYAAGTMTTGTTAGAITFTPRLGTGITGASLGASQGTTNSISITGAMWGIRGDLVISYPTGGLATGRAFFTGQVWGRLSAAATGAVTENQIFGYTAVTNADVISAATALFMGVTNSSATTPPTLTLQQLRWGSWN